MSQFIYNETLSGVVNGVNKVFTALNTIDSIEDLRLWGVDYVGFSFTGSTVTLTDAPTVSLGSPSIDYFVASLTPSSVTGSTTFGQFCLDVYQDIGQENTSYQYPLSMVKRYAKEELPIQLNKRINPLKKVGSYSFNKAIDLVASAYSASAINVGNIPTYTPATGKLIVGPANIVNYSSITSTSFTSLSGLTTVYGAGDRVTIGYRIPEGVKKVSEVMMDGFPLTFKDFREYVSSQYGCYTVIDGYMFLPRDTNTTTIVTVTFTKDTIIPVEDDDEMDFEPEYIRVLRYAVEVALFAFREDERLDNISTLYKDAWKHYRSYIARQVDSTNNEIPSNIYRGLGRGYNYYGYRARSNSN